MGPSGPAAEFLRSNSVAAPQVGDVRGSRIAIRANTQTIGGEFVSVPNVREQIVPGKVPVRVRIYETATAPAPAPTLAYFHGGGFVVGDLDTIDPVCRRLALAAHCTVVSVDYR